MNFFSISAVFPSFSFICSEILLTSVIRSEQSFPSDLYCDIFSPCALGNIINKNTRESLQCTAIVGAANNQLDNEDTADWLRKNNIVYAPDYLVNSGGVIAIAAELEGTEDNIDKALDEIANKTFEVIQSSNEKGVSTTKISKELALERINKG